MFIVVLFIFTISIFIYGLNISEANDMKDKLEATRICLQAASSISSFASLNGNSTHVLNLPEYLNYKNYTIWVNSDQKIIKVDYEETGVGCELHIANITDSNGSTFFQLQKNATLRNNNWVVTVGQ